MHFETLKDLRINKLIMWEILRKDLEANKTDSQTIEKMHSIFSKVDVNNDQILSQQELKNMLSLLNSIDRNQDQKISNQELSNLVRSQNLGTKNAEDLNQFIEILKSQMDLSKKYNYDFGSTQTNSESIQKLRIKQPLGTNSTHETNNIQPEENLSGIEQDSKSKEEKKQALTEYVVQPGDTPDRIAKKFGLAGEDAKEFIEHLKKQTNEKGWFIVGQKITLLGDHAEAIDNMSDYTEDKAELNSRWANTEAGRKALAQAQKTKEGSPTSNPQTKNGNGSSAVSENALPKTIQDRIESLKQRGDSYEIIGDAQKGYTIKITSGQYMDQREIGLIELKYDSSGKLLTNTQKYNNGQISETTYSGFEQTKLIALPAPEKFQKIAENMQKESGGKARLEYNKETGNYEIIQTDINYKDVKEIRTVLSDKAWQENLSYTDAAKEGFKDAWNSFRLVDPNSWKKAVNAGLKNREDRITDADYILTQTTTYNDGKVVEGTYSEGKLKTNKVIQASKVAAPEKPKENNKINTAADIYFDMPKDAPENAKKFANSLVNNKAELMRQLGIDNDTYNVLAQTAIGIAGKETNFGEQTTRQTAKDILRNMDVAGVKDWSYGMTQLKYSLHTQDPEIKRNMEALGITKEEQLLDPEVSAKATIVLLATLNKRLDTAKYQKGIETAQDTIVQYKGWQINEYGIGEKTGNTEAWTNEISRQDALCALWNGGEAVSLINGTFKPQGWEYTRVVNEYTNKYKLVETKDARAEAQNKSERTRTFEDMTNNGEMGSVVFLPAMYSDKAKHLNTATEIKALNQSLKEKNINPNLRTQLVTALQNGELSFDFGLNKEEIESLTNSDIKLLLMHLKELKTQVNSNPNINTSDGINEQEASILRNKYSTTVGNAENKFRQEYLNAHSAVYNASDNNPKVLRETSTANRNMDFVSSNGVRKGFQHERPLPVNTSTSNGKISDEANALANAGYSVAMQNPNNQKSGYCLTGVKEAMEKAGINISDMSKYGNTPKYVQNWFAAHPEMFTPVEYVSLGDGTAREINSSDITNLPAGYIVIWTPGEEHNDQAGHIAITNGNGQGYADATDNLQWGNYSNNKADSGKGEHGKFVVYKLSDNWNIDPSTGKLVFKG